MITRTESETFAHLRASYLLDLVGAGNQAMFAELYDCIAPEIYAHYLSSTNSRDAEKLTGETFLDIWVHAAHFDSSRQSPMRWIRGFLRAPASVPGYPVDGAVRHPFPGLRLGSWLVTA